MYKKQLDKLRDEISALENRHEALMESWVKECHPLKEGGEVIVNDYSYNGKKMLIYHTGIEETWNGFQWFAYGKILKKDGEPGVKTGEWRQKC